jgi:hypothetical protein
MDDFERDFVDTEIDDDWDDVDLSDISGSDDDDVLLDDEETDDAADGDQTEDADEQEDTAETKGEDKEDTPEGADGNEAKPGEKAKDDQTEPDDGEAKSDQTFTLKHLGEAKVVGRDEVITLAQKGLDYDRIRSKMDALNAEKAKADEVVAFVNELAQLQGMTDITEFIDATRAKLLADKEGIDEKTALERVKLNRERTALQSQKAEAERQKSEQDAAAEKRHAEIMEFLEAYPQIDPAKIPQEVWEQVAKGERLLTAYRNYEVASENSTLKLKIAELERTIEAERKNKENKAKSTGTRSSAGSAPKKDKWFVGWDDD